ncbi:UDP-N-acetylmuramoyl-tripeptide--D-alanyl-D-alanine ligase [Vibrio sp. 10N.286.49.B3]|uniref:UDP-N-acetylmuramoyl-tripeptide--D-alanyl-D- alanine ligase n=1 Tax=Vibrio sp. 10N.286.49.B3 TaxID=1880855 RepID=UPI000C862654|nr:UDP-N-acetylmuramoyl-tripeptide--D-alanyl-D-alanine ligase [Vibrio sp. 10N.286.49.B3]PMH39789.1 UDP-N-acetylmuramoyl-tripeptide--D-alanyl-D-alanine ligase [Vibrio sp. 10N.286.49.B3]
MIPVSLLQLAAVLDGQLIGDDCVINDVSTDTRKVTTGSLFVALIGERFDAHDFAQQAVDNGASALLVSKPLALNIPQIQVDNTQQALGKMGAWVHQQCDTPTVAITGSCGKTTVKEMTASILMQKGQVLFTAGNFNNEIGVPLTLLRSTPQDDYAVIELGANHQHEIAYTTQLVQPDVALVNNVAAAHLEGFGSLDGVKKAKGEIFQGLAENATAVINLDSHGEQHWQAILADKNLITFSKSNHQADYFATDIELNKQGQPSFTLHTPVGHAEIQLTIIGAHNVANALAAAILATQLGASLSDIVTGLTHLMKVKGRVDVESLTEGVTLIDDSYNASVPAVKAAVDLLASFAGQRWLILGNMAELGDESLALHRQVGEYAAPFAFEHVLTYGKDTKVISEVCGGQHFETHSAMITYIKQHLAQDENQTHTLLVKGANSAGMSQVAVALQENFS